MTQAVAHLLGEGEQLPESERRELRHAIVERVPMSEDLTEEGFTVLAVAHFGRRTRGRLRTVPGRGEV